MSKVRVRKRGAEVSNDLPSTSSTSTKKSGAPGGYLVRLKDGRNKLAAVIVAESAGDAKDFFVTLCGIVGTEHPITAEPVGEDHSYTLDDNGIVLAGL